MFRQLIVVGGLLLVLTVQAGSADSHVEQLRMEIPRGELTLEQARAMALRQSPGISAATARIEAAAAVVDQARASLWPQLALKAGYRVQDSTMQPDWDPSLRINENFDTYSGGLQANWLLFDGFARKARILAAKHGVEASQAGLTETRRLLVDAVANAFYQAQLAAESMLIAKNNQEFNKLQESDADKRWQAGTIPEAEKLNFAVRALQAESDYLQAAQNFAVISTVLAELLALPEAQLPQQLYPVSAAYDSSFRQIPDAGLELAYALEHRSDLKVLKANLAALKEQRTAGKGSYYPRVNLYSGLDYSDMNGAGSVDDSQEEHDLYLGLNLEWTLFDGGARSARVQEIDHEAAQVRHQIESKMLQIESEIGQAVARAEQTYAMYQRQHKALEMTVKIRDHIEKAYRAGVTTLTRLNEAQRDLVQMAGLAIYSRINYQIALKDLDTASGRALEMTGE